jgi:phage terminase large subunit
MPTITAEWIEKHYNFLKGTDCPVIACYGGAGSGKSYAICQELIERLFTRKGYVVLVIRKTGPSLLRSTLTMMLDVLTNYGFTEGKDYTVNRSERSIRTANGNIAWFISFGSSVESTSSRERIKSINATDAYIEEATELGFEEYSQIGLRLRLPTNCNKPNQLLLSFNPVNAYHWTKLEIIDQADDKRISTSHSTYLDNPMLSEDYEKNFLEPYKQIDEAYYKMYALGQYAEVRNTIYSNFVIDYRDNQGKPFALGVDFGLITRQPL